MCTRYHSQQAFPAVRGIGNPALCALSSLQSSTATPHTWILPVHVQHPLLWMCVGSGWNKPSHSSNIFLERRYITQPWNDSTRLVLIWFARLSHFHLAKRNNPSVFQMHFKFMFLVSLRVSKGPQAQWTSFPSWTNSHKLDLITSNYCSDICVRDAW